MYDHSLGRAELRQGLRDPFSGKYLRRRTGKEGGLAGLVRTTAVRVFPGLKKANANLHFRPLRDNGEPQRFRH